MNIFENSKNVADFLDKNKRYKHANKIDEMTLSLLNIVKEDRYKIASTKFDKNNNIVKAEILSSALQAIASAEDEAIALHAPPSILNSCRSMNNEIYHYAFSNNLYKNIKVSGFLDVLKNVGKSVLKSIFAPLVPAFERATYDENMRLVRQMADEAESVLEEYVRASMNNKAYVNNQTEGYNKANEALQNLQNNMVKYNRFFVNSASKASAAGDQLNFYSSNAVVETIRGFISRIQSDKVDITRLLGMYIKTLEDVMRSAIGMKNAVENQKAKEREERRSRDRYYGYDNIGGFDINHFANHSYITINRAKKFAEQHTDGKKLLEEMGFPLALLSLTDQYVGQARFPRDFREQYPKESGEFPSKLKSFVKKYRSDKDFNSIVYQLGLNPKANAFAQGKSEGEGHGVDWF